MPTLKKRVNFFESVEGVEFEAALHAMTLDTSYNTEPSYSADGTTYPDHMMPFRDKHKMYLTTHPSIDPKLYLANLRLITRQR